MQELIGALELIELDAPRGRLDGAAGLLAAVLLGLATMGVVFGLRAIVH